MIGRRPGGIDGGFTSSTERRSDKMTLLLGDVGMCSIFKYIVQFNREYVRVGVLRCNRTNRCVYGAYVFFEFQGGFIWSTVVLVVPNLPAQCRSDTRSKTEVLFYSIGSSREKITPTKPQRVPTELQRGSALPHRRAREPERKLLHQRLPVPKEVLQDQALLAPTR